MPNFLTEEEVVILKQTHRTTKDRKSADRIKSVLMFHNGFTYQQIEKALLLDEITISRYTKRFKEKGIEGLLEMKYKGGQTKLTKLQEKELKEYLTLYTKRTVKEISDHILSVYNVRFTTVGTTSLLHRLGFSYKKPKILPGKADTLKQEEFIESYIQTKEGLGGKDRIYFADATHPQHNTNPSYGWILKGKANDKFVKTNTGRERLNLNGAIGLENKTTVVLEEETVNSDSTIRLFKKLIKHQPTGKIHIILDNASHHHSKKVKQWLKSHTRRVKLLFLPPYSPNLNIIERLWRFFHQKLTYNRYFETFDEFRRETLKFFKRLHKYKDELDTLLTDSFQRLPDLSIQTGVS